MLEAGKECWRFFLLDELFKGTNTVERIAIAKAVLSALAHKNSIVFASTHDVELASLLEDEYELFHFCECVADNTLSFDYKLKPGPVTERNAIRIIEMCGYPQEVVRKHIGFQRRMSYNFIACFYGVGGLLYLLPDTF